MKTLSASTPKDAFDFENQNLSECPIDAVELTDGDLEQVAGGCWGGCGWGWGGGFWPGWGWGWGGFSPFWGGGFGRSFAFSNFAGAW